MRQRASVWTRAIPQEIAQFLKSNGFVTLLFSFGRDLPRLLFWLTKGFLLYLLSLVPLAALDIRWSIASDVVFVATLSLMVIDFVNLREQFHLWHWLAPSWWHWSDSWPLTSVLVFVKALPLLGLWLLVAYGVYNLLSVELQEQSASLVGTIVAALVGFGIQQWKLLSDAEREREKSLKDAETEIEHWRRDLQKNLSTGARRYLELVEQEGATWGNYRIEGCLKEAWKTTAPDELRDAIRLLTYIDKPERFYRTAEGMDVSRPVTVLEWALKNLDDDWRNKAWIGFHLLSQKKKFRLEVSTVRLQQVEQRQWVQILRPWLQISLWRDLPAMTDTALFQGVQQLGMESSPFGCAAAETDHVLLKTRIKPAWWDEVAAPQTAFYVGDEGAGKTATALLWTYDIFREGASTFPVYWRGTLERLELVALARAMAQTLLNYLVIYPNAFLQCAINRKSSIAHLFARYLPYGMPFHLCEAGAPDEGRSAQMAEEIRELETLAPVDKLLRNVEVMNLLSQVRPEGFTSTLLLLDIQNPRGQTNRASIDLGQLCDRLARAGIITKVFLPITLRYIVVAHPTIPHYNLAFSKEDLKLILEQRMVHAGDSDLSTWCDPEARELVQDLDDRMVEAADGKPGVLFRKGNDLLRCIGKKEGLLSVEDLSEILGLPIEMLTSSPESVPSPEATASL